ARQTSRPLPKSVQLHERLRGFSRMSLLIATFRLLDYLHAALDEHARINIESHPTTSRLTESTHHTCGGAYPPASAPAGVAQRGARIELPFHTTASKRSSDARLVTARPSGLASRN